MSRLFNNVYHFPRRIMCSEQFHSFLCERWDRPFPSKKKTFYHLASFVLQVNVPLYNFQLSTHGMDAWSLYKFVSLNKMLRLENRSRDKIAWKNKQKIPFGGSPIQTSPLNQHLIPITSAISFELYKIFLRNPCVTSESVYLLMSFFVVNFFAGNRSSFHSNRVQKAAIFEMLIVFAFFIKLEFMRNVRKTENFLRSCSSISNLKSFSLQQDAL